MCSLRRHLEITHQYETIIINITRNNTGLLVLAYSALNMSRYEFNTEHKYQSLYLPSCVLSTVIWNQCVIFGSRSSPSRGYYFLFIFTIGSCIRYYTYNAMFVKLAEFCSFFSETFTLTLSTASSTAVPWIGTSCHKSIYTCIYIYIGGGVHVSVEVGG